jgi:hypothetical protein
MEETQGPPLHAAAPPAPLAATSLAGVHAHSSIRSSCMAIVMVDTQLVLSKVLEGPAIASDEATGKLHVDMGCVAAYLSNRQPPEPLPLRLRPRGDVGSPSGTATMQSLVLSKEVSHVLKAPMFYPCVRNSDTLASRFGTASLSSASPRTAYSAAEAGGGPCLPADASKSPKLDIFVDFYCAAAVHGCISATRCGFMLHDLLHPRPSSDTAGPSSLVPLYLLGAAPKLQPVEGAVGTFTVSKSCSICLVVCLLIFWAGSLLKNVVECMSSCPHLDMPFPVTRRDASTGYNLPILNDSTGVLEAYHNREPRAARLPHSGRGGGK